MYPLDHPSPDRPFRLYYALSTHCNRACPWCSTSSSPRGATWLGLSDYERHFPGHGTFEVQLEGGEPTTHPKFWDFVALARAQPRCQRLILCTNGVCLPRDLARLSDWVKRLGQPLTLKLSINHHLLDTDAGLISLARALLGLFRSLGDERLLVLNVRLRRGVADNDADVLRRIEDAGLRAHANVFFLQRYGLAREESSWEEPFLVGHHFALINPDGTSSGTDLIARSEAMGRLP